MRGFVCEICDKEIMHASDALETVPVHIVCVPFSKGTSTGYIRAGYDLDRALSKPCTRCGKSDSVSRRRRLSRGGLLSICNRCVRERNAEKQEALNA